jgi:CRISPR type III-B/RAMP module RAMP protein Cmr6
MLAVTKTVQTALGRCDAWTLRLDKFSFERGGDASAKTDSLKNIRDCYQDRSFSQLGSVCRSRRRLLEALKRQHGTRFALIELYAESRLLLHLGRASVLENVGLCTDRTTGLPVIPGTALKGVLSTWACWEANQKPDGSFNEGTAFIQKRKQFSKDLARRVFGDDSKDGSDHAGDVIFVGGFPATTPMLGLDIVNPHYDADGRDKIILTPNVFLCVEPDTKWHFAFYVRPGAPDAVDLLTTTVAWLTEALTQLGIGAKTAAGYGRFRQLNEADIAAQAKEAEKAKADDTAAAEQAKVAADNARVRALAQDALKSDYPNDGTFKNRVLDKLNPGQLNQLLPEIPILQKPENEARREQFRKLLASRDYKDIRKRLRDKDWFPKEWLPSQP